MSELEDLLAVMKDVARDMRTIKQELGKVINYMVEAESEIPEKMRRFIMYMHDVHDVSYMYEERGIPVPDYIRYELQRCDDRYRQLLKELHSDVGTFEKVRQEMSQHADNRWEHGRLFPKSGDIPNATGSRPRGQHGKENGTQEP